MYRSRNGMVAGVCRGIAEYFEVSVFFTRGITVFILLCTGLWPTVGLYFLAALIMKKEPYVRWS
jgi:phage shock protein C